MKIYPSYVKSIPVEQAEILYTKANPVSGTKYDVFALSGLSSIQRNIRVYAITLDVTWTAQPDPLEAHTTTDGIAKTATQATPVSGTDYHLVRSVSLASGGFDFLSTSIPAWILGEWRSFKLEIETTGGTVSQLRSRVRYSQW